MSIEIISVRQNENDQTVFFTIDVPGEKDPLDFHGDCPLESSPQDYFDNIADEIRFLILCKMYKDADWQRFKNSENTILRTPTISPL